MKKPTPEDVRAGITKVNQALTRHTAEWNLPIRLNVRNLIIAGLLGLVIWLAAGDWISSKWARLFPEVDWQNLQELPADYTSDRNWSRCVFKVADSCSPRGVQLCDEAFHEPEYQPGTRRRGQ
jgi:hypothetical protein